MADAEPKLQKEGEISPTQAAYKTLQDALRRAAPVLRTAVGGALFWGSVSGIVKLVPFLLNQHYIPSVAQMMYPSIINVLSQTVGMGVGGVVMMKRPVTEAIKFFKEEISKKRKPTSK